MKAGLNQLTIKQLQSINETPNELILTDGGNYEQESGRFCPLAIAFNLHTMNISPCSNELVDNLIGVIGKNQCGPNFIWNQMRGIQSEFFHGSHEERVRDLKKLIEEILLERLDKK